MDADAAVADLMEISSQVEAAALLDASGAVLASAGGGEALAAPAREALEEAGGLRGAEAAAPTQLEVSTAAGSFFVVRAGDRTVAATTGPNPTAGLVLYDLRTALRRLEEQPEQPRPKPRRKRAKAKADEAA